MSCRMALGTMIVLTLAHTAMAAAEGAPALKFRDNGTFRIVQFADTHWAHGGKDDRTTQRLMELVLDEEKPDLVVFTGDNISGSCFFARRGLRRLVAPCVEREIPWAAVFGNHDDEGRASRQEQMAMMRDIPFCLATAGPEEIDGVSNYVLTVAPSKGGELPAAALYCLDSLAYMQYEGSEVYNFIQPKQVQWYRHQSTVLTAANGGRPLPALAFFHIPLPEYDTVWNAGGCIGVKQEGVCCSPVNSGLFEALKAQGDVMGTFVGHDHVNDYIGALDGIYLAYGRGSGYNTYGADGFPRGARVIELIEGERRFRTWLRLDDNTVVSQLP